MPPKKISIGRSTSVSTRIAASRAAQSPETKATRQDQGRMRHATETRIRTENQRVKQATSLSHPHTLTKTNAS
jgi:hypothetical protein